MTRIVFTFCSRTEEEEGGDEEGGDERDEEGGVECGD